MHVTNVRPLPPRPHAEYYKKQAKALLKSVRASEPSALARVRAFHPRISAPHSPETIAVDLTLSDAQLVIAREHGFESWPKLAAHIEAVRRLDSSVAAFESAADAIALGDATTLAELLRANPHLVRERSSRAHHATLLHYTGANGVEDYRQKTPANIVEIAALLLDAGAEIDAVADIYGQSATLSLAASSVHPHRMGVQVALMTALLEGGAAIDGPPGSANPVLSALRNGRREAALFLADRGATLDLESAAGVGRADLVQTYLTEGRAHQKKLEYGFAWACEYGHVDVVELLLAHGVDINALYLGQSGLHWAAIGVQVDLLKLLLTRGASTETRNVYGATPLGQAQWSAAHSDDPATYDAVIALLDS
ncbi:MAG TPA: ankyrin repeat domain-containing protein [Candidatus Baltobacteraceae bacterium]|nr:ankyrin repeat domain-containing protein [Candidatus Baltobacteraceae bacterium]